MFDFASSEVCRRSTSFLREVTWEERVPAEKRAMNSFNWAIFFSRWALPDSMRGADLGLGEHHVVVAAGVGDDGLVVDIGDVGADVVEEVAVVRDDDEAAVVGAEIILEPVDGIEIEVVGRLVEQEDAGVAEEGLSEQDADFLAALELTHLALVQRWAPMSRPSSRMAASVSAV